MAKIKVGIEKMYNNEFDEANEIYAYVANEMPNHPVGPFLKGLNMFWKYFPIVPGDENEPKFIDPMDKAIELSEDLLDENDDNMEASFFNLVSRAMIMLHYADNGMSGKVIAHANTAYKHTMRSFEYKNKFVEYYFFTGLYNYYIEAYPEAHPVYKPIIAFFKDGNKELGLEELDYATKNCTFLTAEALQFASSIQISFEEDPDKAVEYAKTLHEKFPGNTTFRERYAEYLIANKEYSKAKMHVYLLLINTNDMYNYICANILQGVIEERQNINNTEAIEYYTKGIKMAEPYGHRSANIRAMAYQGLSRIYASSNPKKAKEMAKKAKDLVIYEYVLW